MDREIRLFFHGANANQNGFYIVVSDTRNHDRATCISLENGMKEEEAIARVRQAFAALAIEEKAA